MQLLLGGRGAEVGKDRRIHQLRQLLLAELQFAAGDGLLNAREDDAANADRGGAGERVGVGGLAAPFVDQIDKALEGVDEQQPRPLAPPTRVDSAEVGDPLVAQQETQHRVGGGAGAVAPAFDAGDGLLGVGKEFLVGLGEDRAEAVIEVGEVLVKAIGVDLGALKQGVEVEIGVAAPQAEVEQRLAQAGALVRWVGLGNGWQTRRMYTAIPDGGQWQDPKPSNKIQAMRTGTMRRTVTFARAARCYWIEVFPFARRELGEWRRRAEAIPEPALRRDALLALGAKSGNAEGLAAFAVLAPRAERRAVIRAVVAYQTALDYLDNVTEHPVHSHAERLKLNGALEVAVDSELSLEAYREETGQRADHEYLVALVEACRSSLGGLPSYSSAVSTLRRRARLGVESQAMNNSLLLGTDERQMASVGA